MREVFFAKKLLRSKNGVSNSISRRALPGKQALPESSYGATMLTLVLKDGRRVSPVHLAWGRNVIKATGPEEESLLSKLDPSDIVDVLPEP